MLSTSESSRLAVGGQRQRCTRPSSYALGVKSFSNKCSGRRAPRCDVRRRSGIALAQSNNDGLLVGAVVVLYKLITSVLQLSP